MLACRPSPTWHRGCAKTLSLPVAIRSRSKERSMTSSSRLTPSTSLTSTGTRISSASPSPESSFSRTEDCCGRVKMALNASDFWCLQAALGWYASQRDPLRPKIVRKFGLSSSSISPECRGSSLGQKGDSEYEQSRLAVVQESPSVMYCLLRSIYARFGTYPALTSNLL